MRQWFGLGRWGAHPREPSVPLGVWVGGRPEMPITPLKRVGVQGSGGGEHPTHGPAFLFLTALGTVFCSL